MLEQITFEEVQREPGYQPPPSLATPLMEAARRAAYAAPHRIKNVNDYLRDLTTVSTLLHEAQEGVPGKYKQLMESFGTADFDHIFTDSISRMLLGQYQSRISPYQMYCLRHISPDFRAAKLFQIDGLGGSIPERGERELPTFRFVSDSQYTHNIKEYRAATNWSWRTMINDDLGALTRVPQLIANAFRRTEGELATRTYCGASGINTTFFTTANGNILTAHGQFGIAAHAHLSPASLQAAMTQLMARTGPDGEDTGIEGMHLVVGDGLALVAQNIVMGEWRLNQAGGTLGTTSGQQLVLPPNVRVQVHVDPYIKNVATTANANTFWMLCADPMSTRPAFSYSKLAGNEMPYMLRRLPMYQNIGGGGGVLEDTEYHFGLFHSQITVDHRQAVASNGTG